MAAASCPPGAEGTGRPCPAGPDVMPSEGSSRRGLPRAGRTASGAGAGAGAGVRPGLSCCVLRCTGSGAVAGAAGAVGSAGVAAAAGGSPVICRSRMAGRRATVSGGAVRRGRTAAGRARSTAEAAAASGAAGAEEAGAAPAFEARCTAGMATEPVPGSATEAAPAARAAPAPEPEPEVAPDPEPEGAAAPAPEPAPSGDRAPTSRTGFRVVPPDRWTDALRPGVPGFPPPARPATAAVPVSASASAPSGRAARSSSGPPGEAERAEPGRVTPWMRPTGADGRTAWPSSPPRVGFCQEASWDRNRSPSLTPIEDRATVTAGGAT